jgi:hypothetical protein
MCNREQSMVGHSKEIITEISPINYQRILLYEEQLQRIAIEIVFSTVQTILLCVLVFVFHNTMNMNIFINTKYELILHRV